LLAAVDRMGQHAFYYLSLPRGGVAFGTEAGAAMACAGRQAAIERQGVYNYIYFHMVPSPGTAFAELEKLPAGHYLDCFENRCRTINYWQPQFQESTADSDFDALCSELRQVLRVAVQNNRSDSGKVGAFLSGGLDSSTVTGVLSELEEGTTEAYAIGFVAEGYDEIPFARVTARHFGVHLNEYYVTPVDVVDALPLIATSTSCGEAKFLSCSTNTRSKPSSFPQANMYGVLSVKLSTLSRFLSSLRKSSRLSVLLPRSSQKCDELDPLPPLPIINTNRSFSYAS